MIISAKLGVIWVVCRSLIQFIEGIEQKGVEYSAQERLTKKSAE